MWASILSSISFVFVLLALLNIAGALPLSSCGVIESPGYYTLVSDITNTTTSICFWIRASNVTIDGNAHVLLGSPSGIGMLIGSNQVKAINITIENISLEGWSTGISVKQGENVRIYNAKIENGTDGISLGDPLRSSSSITIDNCTLKNNIDYGITIGYNIENITIKDSVIIYSYRGISYGGSSYYPNITVYNNFFNTTLDAVESLVNFYGIFNTTKRAGINIIGGSYIGGNYWGRTDGNGFSDTCIDTDDDGICDSPSYYQINSMSYDHLPLAGAGVAPPPIEEYQISGKIYYSGNRSGIIYIEVLYSCDPFAAPLFFTNISSPGDYTINVTSGSYYVRAFMDANGNLSYDAGEPYGMAINKSTCADADLINIFNAGVSGVDITIYEAESTPPLVYIILPQNKSYNTTSIPIEVSAMDDTGIDTVIAELDGVNITLSYSAGLYRATATGLGEGMHHLKVYANDTFGNVNSSEEVYFSVDTTLPSLTFVAPTPANGTLMNARNATWIYINVTADEPLSGAWLEYWNERIHANISLNGSLRNWHGNFSPADGAYYYRAWGNDSAGNKNATGIRFIWIDTTLPNITIYSPRNTTYTTSDVGLNLSASEPVSAWWYSLDRGANVSFTPNTTLQNLGDGLHLLEVYARDPAGNTGNAKVVFTVALPDITPPLLSFVSPTPENGSIVNTSYIYVNVTSSEPLSQAVLEWNGANYTMYGSGVNWHRNFTIYYPGYYHATFRVHGRDVSGNWGSTEKRLIIVRISRIDGCTVIGYPGVYTLTKDIVNSTSSMCIWILSSDVVIEGASHAIDGVQNVNSKGIYVYNSSGRLRNITVRNLTLTDWDYGIYIYRAEDSLIEKISASDNTVGAHLTGVQNITLQDSTFTPKSGGDGVYLSGSNCTIKNNAFLNTAYALRLYRASENSIHNNVVAAATGGYGIYLSSSPSNTLRNNQLVNGSYGIYLTSSLKNFILENGISSAQYGIYLENSGNCTLHNNILDSSFRAHIYLNASGYSDIARNILENWTDGIETHNSPHLSVINNTARELQKFLSIYNSSDSYVINNTVTYIEDALEVYNSSRLDISHNIFISNFIFSTGILMENSNDSTIHTNRIEEFEIAVELFKSYGNLIFNNLFNISAVADNGNNQWNTTKRTGVNIVGGPYIGGNYWALPDGTGYSDACTDSDADGICDLPYTTGNVIDYLPLARYDTQPPQIEIIAPSQIEKGSNFVLNITITDRNPSEYNVTGNGSLIASGGYISGTPIILNQLYGLDYFDTGDLSYEVCANDSYNNSNCTSVVVRVVDTTPPSITLYSPQNITYFTDIIDLKVSASEPVSAWWYSLDGGANVSFTPNITINVAPSRSHTLTIYARDLSGNVGKVKVVFTVANLIRGCMQISAPGTYFVVSDILNSSAEKCVVISSGDVILEGEGHVIDGRGGDYGIYISPSQGRLENVTIRNLTLSEWEYGAYVSEVDNSTFSNLSIENGIHGMEVWYGDNNTFAGITFLNNYDGIGMYAGDSNVLAHIYVECSPMHNGPGVWLDHSNYNFLWNISVTSCNDGIILGYSSQNTLRSNSMMSNTHNFGVLGDRAEHFRNNITTTNLVEGKPIYYLLDLSGAQVVANAGYVGLVNCSDIRVMDTRLTKNYQGVLLVDSTNITVSNATLSQNRYGIYIRGGSNSTIVKSTIEHNSYAGIYTDSSPSNYLIYNNLLNNSLNVFNGGRNNHWNTTKQKGRSIVNGPFIGGNYWGKPDGRGYSDTCSDNNGDGICDSPYTLGTYVVDYLPLTFEVKPPEINIISPQSREYTSPPLINISTMDLSGISLATVEVDNRVNITLSLINGYYLGNLSPLWPGKHLLRIYVWDSLGNGNSTHVAFSLKSASHAKAHKNLSSGKREVVNETLGNTSVELEIAPLVNDSVFISVNESTNVSQLANTTNEEFSAFAIANNAQAIGRFVRIEVNGSRINNTANLSYVIVKLHYTTADLDKNGDGDYSDPGDIDPRTLHFYRYCPDTGTWDEVPHGRGWVCGNVEVFNSSVNLSGRYVWANLSHLSVFGIAGKVVTQEVIVSVGGEGGTPEIVAKTFNEITKKLLEEIFKAKNLIYRTFVEVPKQALASLLSIADKTKLYPFFEELKDIVKKEPEKLEGDIYEITAEQVLSKYTWVPRVIIARGDLEVDSYAALALAKAKGAPILLTKPDELPEATLKAIEKLKPKEIIIVGGPKAVSENVEAKLKEYAKVTRLWGATRIETSVEIAKQFAKPKYIVIANWSSSEKAAYIAYLYKAPVLYVKGREVPNVVEEYIKEKLEEYPKPKIVFVDISREAKSKIENL